MISSGWSKEDTQIQQRDYPGGRVRDSNRCLASQPCAPPRVGISCDLLAMPETPPGSASRVSSGAQTCSFAACLFLQLLEQLQVAKGDRTPEIYLPMSRSDIGEYVGMWLEAVSRAFRILATRGVIKIRSRRYVKIADRDAFDRITADPNGSLGLGWTTL